MGSMPKRILLFVLTNLAIILTLNVVFFVVSAVFGINVGYMSQQYGIDYTSLMIVCLVWGMGGSFISLLLSKKMAKWMMGLKIIDPAKSSGSEMQIVHKVHELARKANLNKMPEVAIYESPEVNAFATGPSRNNSLVAVSTGLLNRMNFFGGRGSFRSRNRAHRQWRHGHNDAGPRCGQRLRDVFCKNSCLCCFECNAQ